MNGTEFPAPAPGTASQSVEVRADEARAILPRKRGRASNRKHAKKNVSNGHRKRVDQSRTERSKVGEGFAEKKKSSLNVNSYSPNFRKRRGSKNVANLGGQDFLSIPTEIFLVETIFF